MIKLLKLNLVEATMMNDTATLPGIAFMDESFIPVTTIDGQPVGSGHVGKLTRVLTELYWKTHNREGWCDRVEDVIRH